MKPLWYGEDRFIQIKDWLELFENKCILEIGIGGGHVSKFLSEKNTVYCIDYDIELINKFKKFNLDSVFIFHGDARKLSI
jgi:16S rRNA A1518/A1519 N6-dimethyltransferase RsmA/KsgA/DIM1 with predicted DNA glycosylase/AP lyase activity